MSPAPAKPKLNLKRAGPSVCPHCQAAVLVRSSPRCSHCGEALQEGVVNWKTAEAQRATPVVRDDRPPVEIVSPPVGFDTAQRSAMCKRMRSWMLAGEERVNLLTIYNEQLAATYSPQRAQEARSCSCHRPAETLIFVQWGGRIDQGCGWNNWALLTLLFGVFVYDRKWVDFEVMTVHAACRSCAGRRFWFDRFERFFGQVPNVLRVQAVERIALDPTDTARASRGGDVHVDTRITAVEEKYGFARTLRFQRQLDAQSAAGTTEATEEISVLPGWTRGRLRRTTGDYHYLLRVRGAGHLGFPAGNDGDLLVQVTVQG